MNRSELLNKLSRTPEERLLLGRTWGQIQAAGQRSVPQVTHFLSPDEQNAVGSLLRALGDPPHKFWGGYEEAQRKVCVFIPDWMEWEDFDETPIAVLRATWYAGDSLTHRDILGSLMGQGIKRETGGRPVGGPVQLRPAGALRGRPLAAAKLHLRRADKAVRESGGS